MRANDLLAGCFDPLICDRAKIVSGTSAGKEIVGMYVEAEKAVNMGRSRVPGGFGNFSAKTEDVADVALSDEIEVGKSNFSVYSIDDDVFGMTTLTLLEIERE